MRGQRVAHLVELERLDDGDDQLHGFLPLVRLRHAALVCASLAGHRIALSAAYALKTRPGFARHGVRFVG